jgi:class 3 adenylate cyclase
MVGMEAGEAGPGAGTLLASDAQRDRVVELLKERTADGTLTLAEFADRVDRALTARSRGELAALAVDLPAAEIGETNRRTPRRWVLSVMAGTGMKGRWRCGRNVTAVAVMGGCQLDFRGAEIDADVVHVTAVAVMGGIDIVVPEGIEVTMDGLPVMGGRSMHVKHVPRLPGSPRIVVHAFPIMGGVTVRSRPRKPQPVVDSAAAELPEPRPASSAAPLDGTVTIMFSDLCDYSGITDRLGDTAAHELLREHAQLVRRQIEIHGGREVKANGDGFMVAFPSVVRAVRCAVALQRSLVEHSDQQAAEPVRVHIGIHVGEVVRDGDDFLGSTVIIASRLADMAGPGEILVSSVARELAQGSREFTFSSPRTVTLKGLVDTRQAYPVSW